MSTAEEIQRRAARVMAWYGQGQALVREVDLDRQDGADLVRACNGVLTEAARKRFPFAGYIVDAIGDVLSLAGGIVTGQRYVGAPRPGNDPQFPRASCAEAGGRLDIAYMMLAESNAHYSASTCPQRAWELMYRAPTGASDHYKPKPIDIACPVHGVGPGTPCR